MTIYFQLRYIKSSGSLPFRSQPLYKDCEAITGHIHCNDVNRPVSINELYKQLFSHRPNSPMVTCVRCSPETHPKWWPGWERLCYPSYWMLLYSVTGKEAPYITAQLMTKPSTHQRLLCLMLSEHGHKMRFFQRHKINCDMLCAATS